MRTMASNFSWIENIIGTYRSKSTLEMQPEIDNVPFKEQDVIYFIRRTSIETGSCALY